jgi:ABC-2 type transport system permease protein
MRSLGLLLRRELRTFAAVPHTYAIASAYFLISGVFFAALFLSERLPDLELYYSNIAATLVVLVPIVAMRSFAEERRTGVLDVTLSWPVPRSSVVLAKFLANLAFVGALVSIIWLYLWLLSSYAEVEAGKSLAQFVGLLLLMAAFNALALGVSARATTPAGAAFVGFGVLLALWVMDFVPGWLGGSLADLTRSLNPVHHLEAAGRGVLDLGDALYFLALVVLGLGATFAAILPPLGAWTKGRLRPSVLVLAGSAVLAGGVGTMAASADAQADLTPSARFTVSEATSDVRQLIDGQAAELVSFVQRGGAQEIQIRSLVDSYKAAGFDISLTVVDPDEQPSMARRYEVSAYGETLVRLGDRSELVPGFGEVPLTSVLVRLARGERTACATVGHGERSFTDQERLGYTSFAAALDDDGFKVVDLALGAPGGAERLAACDVVVVAGSQVPLLPSEEELLVRHLEADGRLVVFAPETPDARAQFNRILKPWALGFGSSTVVDRSALADDPGSIVAFSYRASSPVTRHVRRHGIPMVVPAAVAVQPAPLAEDQGLVSILVESSTESHEETGAAGPFALAAISDFSAVGTGGDGAPAINRTRIGVVGSADVAANEMWSSLGNADVVQRLVGWVERDEDLIAAGHDPGGVEKVLVSEAQRRSLVGWGVVAPAVVPLPLLLLSLRRIRRG